MKLNWVTHGGNLITAAAKSDIQQGEMQYNHTT